MDGRASERERERERTSDKLRACSAHRLGPSSAAARAMRLKTKATSSSVL